MEFHGHAKCKKDVPHDFPHGRITVGDVFGITAWLPIGNDWAPEEDIVCILLPNPEPPEFFLFRMDTQAFNKWFERVDYE